MKPLEIATVHDSGSLHIGENLITVKNRKKVVKILDVQNLGRGVFLAETLNIVYLIGDKVGDKVGFSTEIPKVGHSYLVHLVQLNALAKIPPIVKVKPCDVRYTIVKVETYYSTYIVHLCR